MLFDQGPALGGLSYQVTSLVNAPSEQALDTAPPPPAVIKDDYQEVPASYDSLRALADSIVRQGGCEDPARQGGGAAGLARRRVIQVHAEGPDRARRERAVPVPHRHQERLLPAVLVRDGGARAAGRHPVQGRLRLHLRLPRRRRRMAGHHARRACLAGAVLLGVRVAAIRAHPVRPDRAGDRVPADLRHAVGRHLGRDPGPVRADGRAGLGGRQQREPGARCGTISASSSATRAARTRARSGTRPRPRAHRARTRGRCSAWWWPDW